MTGQKDKIRRLRAYNRWRRGGRGPMVDPKPLGELIDWAIGVCEAADKLVNGSGRQKPDAAYRTLERALNGEEDSA